MCVCVCVCVCVCAFYKNMRLVEYMSKYISVFERLGIKQNCLVLSLFSIDWGQRYEIALTTNDILIYAGSNMLYRRNILY